MQESLNRNELRPYEYIRNYAREITELRDKPHQSYVRQEASDENMKIISASPYRATIKVEQKLVMTD
jgi:hypothetical protein